MSNLCSSTENNMDPKTKQAVVIKSIAPLFNKPDSYGTIIDEVLFGMRVEVLGEANGYMKIATEYRYSVYLRSDDAAKALSIYARPKMDMVRTRHYSVDVMSMPAYQSKIIISLTKGAVLYVEKHIDPQWLKVILPDGLEGYVKKI